LTVARPSFSAIASNTRWVGAGIDRASPVESRRVAMVAFLVLAVGLVFATVGPFLALAPSFNGFGSVDFNLYRDAAQRWLAGGSFYPGAQLSGAYPLGMGSILYPPVALWLLIPFTVLPAILWWAIPLALTGWGIWRLRPGFVVWPLLALCVAWPPTLVKLATGNPVMWVMAAMTIGVVAVGPAVFVLLKPSLFPFALWGARRRSWWIWMAAFLVASVPFGAMWGQWLTAVMNAQGGGLLYSVQEIPMLLIPVIAWLARTRTDTRDQT
jgi:hypothetical protein